MCKIVTLDVTELLECRWKLFSFVAGVTSDVVLDEQRFSTNTR